MITKQGIRNMTRHILRRSEGYPDRRIMHPARDWLIGLAVTVLLFLSVSAAAGYLFWDKSSGVTDAYDATVESVAYDQKLVDRVLERYRARDARYESLGGNAVPASEATSTSATTVEKVSPAPKSDQPPVAE